MVRKTYRYRSHFSLLEAFLFIYKSPLPKRSGGLQWRILHCVLATNVFVSKFNLNVLPFCHFCNSYEMVFHVFIECSRLVPLFAFLERIIDGLGFDFNKILFIYGCRYSKVNKERCTVICQFYIWASKISYTVSDSLSLYLR